MTADGQASDASPKQDDAARGRSLIEFPYFDLDSAIEVARAVRDVGGNEADQTSVAVKLDMSAEGGGFRQRLISAKTFGLIEYSRGTVSLTDLGARVVDPQYERGARVDAFLSVPLYKGLFDRLNGQTLPPPPAIERMAEALGVAPKQKDKARQVFMRSAKSAGLFELSNERLSLPPSVPNGGTRPHTAGPTGDRGGGGGGSGGGRGEGGNELDLDPLLVALLQKIPPKGEPWPQDRRLRWFRTFAMNVSQVYDADDAPVELDIRAAGSGTSGGAS